jgi:hypothetical protein
MIAGSMKTATFKPTVPSTVWPNSRGPKKDSLKQECDKTQSRLNFSKQAYSGKEDNTVQRRGPNVTPDDEYGLSSIDDSEILKLAERVEHNQADEIDDPTPTARGLKEGATNVREKGPTPITQRSNLPPARLPNGRYQCRHACKDKSKCKHMCCREGLDLPPKDSKKGAKAPTSRSMTRNTSAVANSKNMVVPMYDKQIEIPEIGGYAQLDFSYQSPKASRIQKPAPALKALQALQEKAQGQQNRPCASGYKRYNGDNAQPIYVSDHVDVDFEDTESAEDNLPSPNQKAPFLDNNDFKDVDDLSDLPILSEIDSKEVILPGLQGTGIGLMQEQFSYPGTKELDATNIQHDNGMDMDLDDFTKFVDWDDDYVDHNPTAPHRGGERSIEDDITTHPEDIESRKRAFNHSESSSIFVHDAAEAFNRGNNVSSSNKRPRREAAIETEPLKEIPQAPLVPSNEFNSPETGFNQNGIPKNNEDTKNDTNPDAEVTGADIEWLLREFGTCVEFV